MGKNLIERIGDVLRYYNVTPNEMAKKIGISSTNAYNYVNGRVKEPPLSFVISFLESFDEVSAEWLLRGEGEMLKPAKKSHYLEMAEKVNGTMMASENTGEPLNLQTMYDSLMKTIEQQGKRLARLEELSKYDK